MTCTVRRIIKLTLFPISVRVWCVFNLLKFSTERSELCITQTETRYSPEDCTSALYYCEAAYL